MSNPAPLSPFWNDSQTVLLRKILTNQVYQIGNGTPISFAAAPATSASAGTAGNVAYDSSYFYVCISANNWRRVSINDW